MILRSPTENENGGLSFHMVPSSTRHSRARGNPGLLRRISLDTRFRGYDGTQAGLLVLIPKRVFSKEITKATKVSHIDISKLLNFVLFVTFVVKSIFFFRSRRQLARVGARAIGPRRHLGDPFGAPFPECFAIAYRVKGKLCGFVIAGGRFDANSRFRV